MFIVFNIIVIGLVGLIAYWWANQGLFSAILHLVCVIAAGALALALWEPVTTGFLLRGNAFDDFAWGISLIGMFGIFLLILRVAMDKLVPGNVALPPWANLTFGLPVGAASGVITVGIFLIGAGFIQSARNIMGFEGVVRSQQRGARIETGNQLWAPVHHWTYLFYSQLSVGSLYPTFNNTPLRQYYPQLDAVAASLVRDSYKAGRGKLALAPGDAQIEEVLYDANQSKYAVRVRFETGARDFGEQLTLSSAQIRLIGQVTGNEEAPTVHPDAWSQYDGRHIFDDVSHYITSEPGQATATAVIEFPAGKLGATPPAFIQIRGTRYRLPRANTAGDGGLGAVTVAATGTATVNPSAPSIQEAVTQHFGIQPISASTNQTPPGIELNEDNFIVGGSGDFVTSGGERPSRKLLIQGIAEPVGTRLVQVDVSRESPANLFGPIRDRANSDDKIMLVDNAGRTYLPIGYLHSRPDNKTAVKVDFQRFLPTMLDLPQLPTSGGQPLRLVFCVTENSTIVGLNLGKETVGTCTLQVKDPKGGAPPADPAAPGETPPTAGGSGMMGGP